MKSASAADLLSDLPQQCREIVRRLSDVIQIRALLAGTVKRPNSIDQRKVHGKIYLAMEASKGGRVESSLQEHTQMACTP
jgi:hypothetical protein